MQDHSKKTQKRIRGSSVREGKWHKHHHLRSRRDFLSAMGITTGMSMMFGKWPLQAATASPLGTALLSAETDRVLVLLQLNGGNDGLNTLIPLYDYDFYRNQRPRIGIPESQMIALDQKNAIQNGMSGMKDLWDNGAMKVVQNVGYPDHNLSHFRSTDIWSAASADESLLQSGWLGRWLDEEYPDFDVSPPDIPPAIQIGNYGSLIFNNGVFNLSVSVSNPEELAEIAQNGELYDTNGLPDSCYGNELKYIRTVTNSTFSFAQTIKTAYDRSSTMVTYDNGFDLATQLQLVARLIKGGLGTPVYLVSLSGFDTHANQNQYHPALWSGISEAIRTFYIDLAGSGWDDKVLTMSFSEFGRRIEENASSGTDHGTSAPMFLFGKGLDGQGIYGSEPHLRTPDQNGNLVFNTDFRSVYATVLEQWLCVDGLIVDQTLGSRFERINDLVLDCRSATNTNDFSIRSAIRHKALYNNAGDISIQFDLPAHAQVFLTIYGIDGRRISTLCQDSLPAGKHAYTFAPRLHGALPGHYLYQLIVDGAPYSAPIVVRQ